MKKHYCELNCRICLPGEEIVALIPRKVWLKNRICECLDIMSEARKIEDWESFKISAMELAEEILYATTEWDKFYNEK